MKAELFRRLAPFLDLLDARFLPLLFAYAPQAYTVYAWLLGSGTPESIAQLGGIGFEFISVGAIAWAERGAGWQAARGPALTALAFSVAVAVAHYAPTQGTIAILHAGFPLVAYFYTLMMHSRQPSKQEVAPVVDTPVAAAQAVVNLQVNQAQPMQLTASDPLALPQDSATIELDIVDLVDNQGMSYAQAGKALGVTRQAATQQYKRKKGI